MLFFIMFFVAETLQGQGKIVIQEPASVRTMMEQFVLNGKANETVKAWRIQIITTDDRREMESVRSRFINMYPSVSMDWKHVVPYYQIRVGAFEDKNKMMSFLLILKKHFPAATPVYDQISKRTLVYN
ncbi:MAG: hypothetical protein WAT79_01385 [Saprospiraceae bacterium]